ncbi:hypothetical protein [Streptomyces acidiscabies]|uniref:hypothetical protein n=1 Tax=Streptomyces acidiscabies TaxID=42234 RepID=UPI0009519820|nr:hypothetical protein [Streptomyces acidiscabies]
MSAPTTVQWLRRAVERIAVGSGRRTTQAARAAVRLARRVWNSGRGWLDEATGAVSWVIRAALLLLAVLIVRKVVTAIAVGLYGRIADGGAPWLLWGAALAWTIAAYRAGTDDWKPEQAAEDVPATASEDKGKGEDEGSGEEPPEDPRVRFRNELAVALHTVGSPHAHISALAEYLTAPADRVRAALTEVGIPISGAVRMKGRPVAVSPGVKREDFPPLPPLDQEGPPGGVLACNNNSNNSDGEGPREGLRVERTDAGITIYDLADTHRHHKITD